MKNKLQTGWYRESKFKTMVFYDSNSGKFYDPMFDEIVKPSGSLEFKFRDGLILVEPDADDLNEGNLF